MVQKSGGGEGNNARAPDREMGSTGAEHAPSWSKSVQGLAGLLQWPETDIAKRSKALPTPWNGGGAWCARADD
jgi:hypothetical protein